MKATLLAGIAVLALPVSLGHAATPNAVSPDLAKAFGARESVQQISLSPDGNSVAMIMPLKGRGAELVIADLTTGKPRPILSSSGDPARATMLARADAFLRASLKL